MAKFWNKLVESKHSLNTEIQAIEALLAADGDDSVGFDGSFSVSLGFDGAVNSLLEQNFLAWQHRRNFITLEQLKCDLGITEIIKKSGWSDDIRSAQVAVYQADDCNIRKKNLPKSAYNQVVNCNLDDYLNYAEFIINILPLAFRGQHDWNRYSVAYQDIVERGHTYNGVMPGMTRTIVNNIRSTVAGLGHKIVKIESEDSFRIVPIDAIAINAAVEVAADNAQLADDILTYKHHSLKGNLKEKAAILNRLNIESESKWEKVLKNRGHATLGSDIGYIADKFGIRHAAKCKDSKVIAKFDNAKKEAWLDKLFALYIAAHEICKAASIHDEIKQLKEDVQTEGKE